MGAWVIRPERPKGVKDEIKQARRVATLKSGPLTSSITYHCIQVTPIGGPLRGQGDPLDAQGIYLGAKGTSGNHGTPYALKKPSLEPRGIPWGPRGPPKSFALFTLSSFFFEKCQTIKIDPLPSSFSSSHPQPCAASSSSDV